MSDFLNMKETADRLGVHPITINRYCKAGRITYYQVGARKRFKPEDVQNFIEGAKHDAAETSKNPFFGTD